MSHSTKKMEWDVGFPFHLWICPVRIPELKTQISHLRYTCRSSFSTKKENNQTKQRVRKIMVNHLSTTKRATLLRTSQITVLLLQLKIS